MKKVLEKIKVKNEIRNIILKEKIQNDKTWFEVPKDFSLPKLEHTI